MDDKKMIPWVEEEGIYMATALQQFLLKLKLPIRITFIPKKELKEASELNDEEFEKTWDMLKKMGKIKRINVKYENGKMIQVYDPTHPDLRLE